MAYVVPQVLINQRLSEVSLNTIQNQNVLVIGPNYALYRYSNADEKAKTYIGRYDGSVVNDDENQPVAVDGVISYPVIPADSVPEAAYTKLFADDLVIGLFDEDHGFTKLDDKQAGADFDGRIKFDFALVGKRRGTEVISEIDSNDQVTLHYGDTVVVPDMGRDIYAGDVIRIDYTDAEGKPQHFQSVIDLVFSSDGGDIYDSVQIEDTLPDEILGMVLSNDNVYEGTVTFCAKISGVEIKQKTAKRNVWNWQTVEDEYHDIYGIDVKSGMKIPYTSWDADREFNVLDAKLYVTYRALLTASASDISAMEHSTYVERTLGTIDPDNPLAFGTYMAALNCGDRLVYYCGVKTNDLEGYNEVLAKASLTDEVYFIVPLTTDSGVISAVNKHCEDMSGPENKLWRVGFVSQEPPTTDMIYDKTANIDNEPFYAKFMVGNKKDGEYDLMQFVIDENNGGTNTVVKCLSDVEAGDKVRVYTGKPDDEWDETPGYQLYTVRKVVSNSVLLLTDGVEWDGFDPEKFYKVEVYRVLSHARTAQYIADQSSRLASRRMYSVFPSVASVGGVSFGGEFLAAAAAGLASSVLPQQPITNVELNGIDDIPVVYQTYSKSELNTIAAGGTFIVMQDRPGSKVYVRHQISTAYTDNNLLKSELSITKNLDSISYYFAEMFSSFIGKYNITPELIAVVRAKLTAGLTALETETAAGLYGPQVLVEGTEILECRQGEVNKDHIYARVHLNLPVPFNYFDLDLEI